VSRIPRGIENSALQDALEGVSCQVLDDNAEQVVVRVAVLEFLTRGERQRLVEHSRQHLVTRLRDALQALELRRLGDVEDPRGMRQEVV